jgi:hypothetical protein
MHLRVWNQSLLIVACFALFWPRPALAPERSVIARVAELVVVGQLQGVQTTRQGDFWDILFLQVLRWFTPPDQTTPQVDVWLTEGRIQVETVLLGPARPGDVLQYQFVCSYCTSRPPIERYFANKTGLWFLRAGADGIWGTAGPSPYSDPGFRGIEELEYFREVLRWRQLTKPGDGGGRTR